MSLPAGEAALDGALRHRATRQVALITSAAKVAGLLRTFVSARVLGATGFADAYTAANTIPNVLVDVVANGVTNAAVVPLQSSIIAAKGRAEADEALSAMLTWIIVITVPLTAVAIAIRHPLASLLLSAAHDPQQIRLASRMLVVLLLQIPLYALGVVMSSALQARRLFVAPAVAPLLSSLVVIVTYVSFAMVSPGREIDSVSPGAEALLVIGTTLGVLALTAPLLVPMVGAGVRLRPTLRLRPGEAKAVVRLGGAGAFALLAQQACTVVMLRLASPHPGGVVIITLSMTVLLLPFSLVAVPLATTSLPELSSLAIMGDHDGFTTLRDEISLKGRRLAIAAVAIVALTAPAAAWVLLRASPGPHGSVGQLALTIAFGAPSIIGLTAAHLTSRSFFATRRWRSAGGAASGGWLLTIVIDLVLVRLVPRTDRLPALGVGLSLGFSVMAVVLSLPSVISRVSTTS